jgi:uncharacterized protein
LKSLLDVNVLIALLDSDHVHHQKATEWLQTYGNAGWSSCSITINGCARILSNPSYPRSLPLAQVLVRLKEATQSPVHESLDCALSLLDETRFSFDRLLTHSQITDVYLFGLAVQNNHRFVTLDSRINVLSVKGAVSEQLVVV